MRRCPLSVDELGALRRVASIATRAVNDTDGFHASRQDEAAVAALQAIIAEDQGMAQVADWARAWVQNESAILEAGDRVSVDERAGLELLRAWGVLS